MLGIALSTDACSPCVAVLGSAAAPRRTRRPGCARTTALELKEVAVKELKGAAPKSPLRGANAAAAGAASQARATEAAGAAIDGATSDPAALPVLPDAPEGPRPVEVNFGILLTRSGVRGAARDHPRHRPDRSLQEDEENLPPLPRAAGRRRRCCRPSPSTSRWWPTSSWTATRSRWRSARGAGGRSRGLPRAAVAATRTFVGRASRSERRDTPPVLGRPNDERRNSASG